MTTKEVERMYRMALDSVVALARASGLNDVRVGFHLRSIAADVSSGWLAELDRRNEKRIAEMKAQSAAE